MSNIGFDLRFDNGVKVINSGIFIILRIFIWIVDSRTHKVDSQVVDSNNNFDSQSDTKD